MKKILSALLVLCLACSLSSATLAYSDQQEISVYIDNQLVSFDVAPVIENGRTLVPMRAIFEALNTTVEWDNATQTVTASTEYLMCLELQIGNLIALKYFMSPSDDYNFETNTGTFTKDQLQEIKLDVPAKLMDGRTLVPLRFIAESMGYQVHWNTEQRRVDIFTNGLLIDLSGLLICQSNDEIRKNLFIPESEPSFDQKRSLFADLGYIWIIDKEATPQSFDFMSGTKGIFVQGKDLNGIHTIQMMDTNIWDVESSFPEISFAMDYNTYSFAGLSIGSTPDEVMRILGDPFLSKETREIYFYNENFIIFVEYDSFYKHVIRITIASEESVQEQSEMNFQDIKYFKELLQWIDWIEWF